MYVCMYVCSQIAQVVEHQTVDPWVAGSLARVYSAFHPSGVGTMSRGELPLQGNEPRTFTKGLKRIGTNQGVATSQLGGTHIHAMHAGGRFGTSVE